MPIHIFLVSFSCDSVMHLCPFCNRRTINVLDDDDDDDDDDDPGRR